ncbi:MAG: acyl carrier protein [Clostridiales bacterium]|nr:acyl carrier protein [Clostridiales bacterium]
MFEKISDIIAKQLRAEADEITEDTNVMDDLGADSLDVVEILMAIEDNFGVSVSDEEIPNLKTVRDIVEYVESNM